MGYAFWRLRPYGDSVGSTGGVASDFVTSIRMCPLSRRHAAPVLERGSIGVLAASLRLAAATIQHSRARLYLRNRRGRPPPTAVLTSLTKIIMRMGYLRYACHSKEFMSNPKRPYTLIPVSPATRDRPKAQKRGRETWDDFLWKMNERYDPNDH